jgi:hypothetical protein
MIPFKFIMLGMPLEDSMGLDVSDMLDYRTLDIYGKRNNVSVICVKQLPYSY